MARVEIVIVLEDSPNGLQVAMRGQRITGNAGQVLDDHEAWALTLRALDPLIMTKYAKQNPGPKLMVVGGNGLSS